MDCRKREEKGKPSSPLPFFILSHRCLPVPEKVDSSLLDGGRKWAKERPQAVYSETYMTYNRINMKTKFQRTEEKRIVFQKVNDYSSL